MPTNIDTVDKIMGYFAMVNTHPFTYKDIVYQPKKLRVSPDIARGHTCPSKCGACCSKFTLDYLPQEKRAQPCESRLIRVSGKDYRIMTDYQKNNRSQFCVNLTAKTGRCKIYGEHPFSCDFELTRFSAFTETEHPNQVTSRLYGRGWNMLRVDTMRGARCEMLPINEQSKTDTIRKLKRLAGWAEYFAIKTRIPKIIRYIKSDPSEAIIL